MSGPLDSQLKQRPGSSDIMMCGPFESRGNLLRMNFMIDKATQGRGNGIQDEWSISPCEEAYNSCKQEALVAPDKSMLWQSVPVKRPKGLSVPAKRHWWQAGPANRPLWPSASEKRLWWQVWPCKQAVVPICPTPTTPATSTLPTTPTTHPTLHKFTRTLLSIIFSLTATFNTPRKG